MSEKKIAIVEFTKRLYDLGIFLKQDADALIDTNTIISLLEEIDPLIKIAVSLKEDRVQEALAALLKWSDCFHHLAQGLESDWGEGSSQREYVRKEMKRMWAENGTTLQNAYYNLAAKIALPKAGKSILKPSPLRPQDFPMGERDGLEYIAYKVLYESSRKGKKLPGKTWATNVSEEMEQVISEDNLRRKILPKLKTKYNAEISNVGRRGYFVPSVFVSPAKSHK
ncbi:MAG TPA: hypothetical protein PLI09_28315 [Candidatus Hydrogenedentes bacterium]|nr:hypothetical protein [Candidatus Hydrogenedentota bacterium]